MYSSQLSRNAYTAIACALTLVVGYNAGVYSTREEIKPREECKKHLNSLAQSSPEKVSPLVTDTLRHHPSVAASVVVDLYYALNPGMSGHTVRNPWRKDPPATVQMSFYTRYAGGASCYVTGKNRAGKDCIVLVVNKRRKGGPYLEPPQGYGNPPPLQPLVPSSERQDGMFEHASKAAIDHAFETQLRGTALDVACNMIKTTSSPWKHSEFHKALTDIARDEIHEEAGLDPSSVALTPIGPAMDSYNPKWGLATIVQKYRGVYQGILPDTLETNDPDEISAVYVVPFDDIRYTTSGEGYYEPEKGKKIPIDRDHVPSIMRLRRGFASHEQSTSLVAYPSAQNVASEPTDPTP